MELERLIIPSRDEPRPSVLEVPLSNSPVPLHNPAPSTKPKSIVVISGLQSARHENDPRKLKSVEVKKDWSKMRCPPLEMFLFSRKVIDEYNYLGGLFLAMTAHLPADRVWILSGAPPMQDFLVIEAISSASRPFTLPLN